MPRKNDFDFIEGLNRKAVRDFLIADSRKQNIIKGSILERMVARALFRLGYKVSKIETSKPQRVDVRGFDKNDNLKIEIECTNWEKFDSKGYPHLLRNKRLEGYINHLSRHPNTLKYSVTAYRDCLSLGIPDLEKLNVTIVELGYHIVPRIKFLKSKDSRPLSIDTYKDVKKRVFAVVPRCS